jgi:hypothetical protein
VNRKFGKQGKETNMSAKLPAYYQPQADGTSVQEVDENGKLTGRQFYSNTWDTRDRPASSKQGCTQWLNQIVVSLTKEGAKAAAQMVTPIATIASSSPSSRAVTAILVDASGKPMGEFTVPYVFVPKSRPAQDPKAGFEVAEEIWFSKVPFNPKETEIAKFESSCAQTQGTPEVAPDTKG